VTALLARRRGFRRLFAANVVSMLGDWLTYVAVGVLALRTERGLADVAVVQLAHTLPQLASAPIAGWLADRMHRGRLMVLASVVRGVLTLGMAVAAWHGSIGWLEALLFLRMAGASFVTAPSSALVPRLVEPGEIAEANALLGLSWAIVFSFGVALGGAVSAFASPIAALAADTATFLVAALMLAGLEVPDARAEARTAKASLWADALAHPSRAWTAMLKAPSQLANGASFVAMHGLVAALVPDHVPLALGALHALRGIGNGLVPWALRSRAAPATIAAIGSTLGIAGACVLAASAVAGERSAAIAIGIAAALLWGAGVGAGWVGGSAALQKVVPDVVLGRYAALDLGTAYVASAIGGVGCAALAASMPAEHALPAMAGVALVLAVIVHARAATAAIAIAIALGLSGQALAPPEAGGAGAASRAARDRAEQDGDPATGRAAIDLASELRARAVSDVSFEHRELWSWTTRAQADAMRSDRRLLRSGARDGVDSPYQRALDAEGAEVEGPRRYAWSTPYGTVLPLGSRSYGDVLVRIVLRREAPIVRYAPGESTFDAAGTAGAVMHVDRGLGLRELVVHGGVEEWSIGTPEIAARVAEDRRVLEEMARRAIRRRASPMARYWAAPLAGDGDLLGLFAATMPFDTPRHRPTHRALEAMREALRLRPQGPPIAVRE
jgi:hypothetical protein